MKFGQVTSVVGNVHVIKRVSQLYGEFELWMQGNQVSTKMKTDVDVTLKGTYSQSWPYLPLWDRKCVPRLCTKGKFADTVFYQAGLAVSFSLAAYFDFMAQITYTYKRDLTFTGDALVHQVFSKGHYEKVQKLSGFDPDGRET